MADLGKQQQRIVYILTYSRADINKFPTRKSFADAVLQAWMASGYAVEHWVVSLEEHSMEQSGSEAINRPYHYHMALKLKRRGRWIQVRKYLEKEFGIQVNFSDHHNTYYSGYRYITKEDEEPLHSEPHPDLCNAPKTEKAINANKRKAGAGKSRKKRRKTTRERALTVYDVSQIIQQRKYTKRLELVCLAVQQKREGNTALAEFIANKGDNGVDDALSVAKEFAEAEAKLARSKKSRIDILREAKEVGHCCEECEGNWLQAAEQLLKNNDISLKSFCEAVFTALQKGRGKYQNIYIHGPANCGKTFILSPLKSLYQTFCNPATGSFAWMGADEAEIIFLNDFRWSAKVIAWADLLQALEGDIVHLPAPKNFCKRDLELSADTPFFATADAPLVLVKGGSIDHANTEMMNVRWRYFHFWKQIPKSCQVKMKPCKHCFANFILDNIA